MKKTRTIYTVTAIYYFGTVINHFKPSEFHLIKTILTSDKLKNISVTVAKEEVTENLYNSMFA